MHLRRGNLFLVGMPGSGKSTLGRILARSLGKTFIDADIELERRLGVAISTIFEIEGEETFRTREEETLARLVQRVDIVLATGGGVVLRAVNRERLRAGGTVLYLHTTPETTHERTRHSKNRPLLQAADPLARARALYSQRDHLYRETCDLVIESDQRKSGHVLSFLHERLGHTAAPASTVGSNPAAAATAESPLPVESSSPAQSPVRAELPAPAESPSSPPSVSLTPSLVSATGAPS